MRNHDAVVPQHGIERMGIKGFGQFDPEREAALRVADAGPFGKVAPHPLGHDIALALVLAPHPAQVRRVMPLAQELRDGNLRQGRGGPRTGVFHAQHFVEVAARRDPAHPQSGRQRLGKRTAQQDLAILVERLQGMGPGPAIDQIAIDVVFDDGHVVAACQPDQAQPAVFRHGVAQGVAGIGNHLDGLDGPALQREFQGLQADALDGVRRNLEDLDAGFLEDLHHAVIAGRCDGHDIARFAQGPDRARQRFLAPGCDDQRLGGDLIARIHGQPGQLLAQGGNALHVVVLQAVDARAAALPGKGRLQGPQAGAFDVRHPPAQLDGFAFAFQIQQILDLPPVRHVDRPQGGLAHPGQGRRGPGAGHVPPGAGARLRQTGHFQPAVGLLDGRQADAVFSTERPDRGQAAAGRIQALFDPAAQGIGKREVTAHVRRGSSNEVPGIVYYCRASPVGQKDTDSWIYSNSALSLFNVYPKNG